MIRFAVLALLIGVFFLLIRTYFTPGTRKEDEEITTGTSAEMVQDPNCETYIPKDQAVEKWVHGKILHFCSETCADEFSRKTNSSGK